jgi:uroporphyrin-III C-methyltransferase
MKKKNIKKISIVGAGPGDPELLTIRALDRITNADVILHDYLIPAAILNLSTAEKIYVGRKCSDEQDQFERQQHINVLMRDFLLQGKNVVRLKSGDPFIFGRAVEEIRYLQSHNIPFEMVPGITAGIAAANLQHIPLTERNRSNAVLFCTGHTANYDFDQLEALANMLRTGTTLVMYMGFKNAKQIIDKLKSVIATETIYLSAISKVSQPEQQILSGTLCEMEKKLEQEHLPMPVVFIVGRYAFPINEESLLMLRENEQ